MARNNSFFYMIFYFLSIKFNLMCIHINIGETQNMPNSSSRMSSILDAPLHKLPYFSSRKEKTFGYRSLSVDSFFKSSDRSYSELEIAPLAPEILQPGDSQLPRFFESGLDGSTKVEPLYCNQGKYTKIS